MTDRILALIDSSPYAESVCRHAAWIASRLGTGIDLVHVIPKDAAGGSDDYTGTLRLGARTALLQKLAAIDAERAKLAKDRGQALLEDARAVLDQDGIADVREKLRQGELVEAVAELEREARAVVIGKRGEGTVALAEGLPETEARQIERSIRIAYSWGRADERRQTSAILRGLMAE